jgi:hypothetical protein
MDVIELLDSAHVSGQTVSVALQARGWTALSVDSIHGPRGSTDFVTITIPGSAGKQAGGHAPTLGILGRLGSLGGRPEVTGLVSDADGAIVALATAFKLIAMQQQGDQLLGDVMIATHISPRSPLPPPGARGIRMMGSPVDGREIALRESQIAADAILSVDATKANRVINHCGFAISPTVKEGYILRPSDDLMDIMEQVTGRAPVILPICTQDLLPTRELRHINSVMLPAARFSVPVVGVALTAESLVHGVSTGANQPFDLESATRFCIEAAKSFGAGKCQFYDPSEFEKLVRLYGSMTHLQTAGRVQSAVPGEARA